MLSASKSVLRSASKSLPPSLNSSVPSRRLTAADFLDLPSPSDSRVTPSKQQKHQPQSTYPQSELGTRSEAPMDSSSTVPAEDSPSTTSTKDKDIDMDASREHSQTSTDAEDAETLTNAAARALSTFTFIEENEYKGIAEGLASCDDSLPCMCQYTEGMDDCTMACGEDSNCINRLLFIECNKNECPAGMHCGNRRFQKKDYAPIEIIDTQGKGFGICAKADIPSGSFVIEYVGEVLSQAAFLKRTKQYSESGQKHFYFMSLKNDELVDATRRGGIARFINHSCNPNCHVQKWVVNKRFRMGVFTKRTIRKGEELTFDYKFERYGTTAQVCLCGEPNCKKVIGTERKSGELITFENDVESDDQDESMDEEERPRVRKERRPSESDDEYEARAPRGLTEPDLVPKLVKSMLSSSGKPSRVGKILDRLVATESLPCFRRFIQLHGVLLLKSWVREHEKNHSICRKVLTVLQKLPIQTRNTVEAAKIEPFLKVLKDSSDVVVSTLAAKLLVDWSKLEMVYRIPKAPKRSSSDTIISPRDSEANGSAVVTSDTVKRGNSDSSEHEAKRSRPENLSNYQQFAFQRTGSQVLSERSFSQHRFASPGSELQRRPSSSYRRDSPRADFDREQRDREYRDRDQERDRVHSTGDYRKETWSRTMSMDKGSYFESRGSRGEPSTTWRKPEVPVVPVLDPPVPAPVMMEVVSTEDVARIIERAKTQAMMEAEQQQQQQQRQLESEEERRRRRKEREKEKEREKARKHQQHQHRQHSSSSSVVTPNTTTTTPGVEVKAEMKKELRDEFSSIVVKYLSRHKDKLGTDEFKRHARKITHAVIEKETRDKEIVSINDEVKRKIKKYVEIYAGKLTGGTQSTSNGS